MTVFALVADPRSVDGWGRYARDVLRALEGRGILVQIAAKRGSGTGREILPEPLSYGKACWFALWYAWRLRRQAARCDVIHAFIEPYSVIAYWLSVLTGKPYVITAHGTFGVLPYTFGFLERFIHARSFSRATAVICVSRYTQRVLQAHGLENLVTIPNGLATDMFGSGPWIPGDYILSVGVLKPRKGLHVSLAAFAQVRQAIPNLRYRMAGSTKDTAYVARLRDLAERLGVAGAVDFLGEVGEEELRSLYRGARAFVLTSTNEGSHFEGFGLVYLEASAYGLPVIGSYNTGAEDAIRDGVTGFLVPQNNSAAIARAIEEIVSNEKFARDMGARGVAWAREHDWSRAAREYGAIYAAAAFHHELARIRRKRSPPPNALDRGRGGV